MRNPMAQGRRRIDSVLAGNFWFMLASAATVLAVQPWQVRGAVMQEPVQETASNNQLDGNAIDVAAMKAISDGISTLKSVRQSLEVEEQFDLGPPVDQSEKQTNSPDLMQLLSSELENARQVEELRDRIRKLIELDRQRILQQSSDRPDNAANSDTPVASSESNPIDNVPANSAADAMMPQVENANRDAEASPELTTVPSIETKRILGRPPDQLALADSLFYSGELELAYDLYRRARTSTSDKSDSVWIDYQTACCLRRLGNTDGASKILREIAESAGAEPVGANARWWLDQIDQKKLIQEELNTFEQFIKRKENEDVTNQGLPRSNP